MRELSSPLIPHDAALHETHFTPARSFNEYEQNQDLGAFLSILITKHERPGGLWKLHW